jgi:hypothetical protein
VVAGKVGLSKLAGIAFPAALLLRAVSKPLDRFENGFVRFLWDPTKIKGKIGASDEQRT